MTLSAPFLREVISRWYGVQPISLEPLPSDSGKHIYKVHLTSGDYWIMRGVEDQGYAPFVDLARLLIFLEQQSYPAERIIMTVEQTAIATVGNWHFCMTSFLAGTPLDSTPTTFRLLGATLARLHALKPSLTYVPSPAEMLPTRELAFAQQQLASISSLVPRRFIAQYEWLEKALSSLNRGTDLPTTLIHNDCHPANALLTAPDQVTLLDWEGAGTGPAVIDLAFLLVNCDGKTPWEPLPAPPLSLDETHLRAVIEGYRQHYQLTVKELDYLPDALRFRSLVFGACDFASTIGRQGSPERSHWWWRYAAAEEIAARTRKYFECAM